MDTWHTGLSLFHSYLDNPEATAAAFDEQGWFDTGDMVTATDDGFITFNGRSGDMLRVGAENVAESEIERVVPTVPGVLEVAVVGRPDEMLDEVPVAFVEAPGADYARKPGRSLLTQIIEQCRRATGGFQGAAGGVRGGADSARHPGQAG